MKMHFWKKIYIAIFVIFIVVWTYLNINNLSSMINISLSFESSSSLTTVDTFQPLDLKRSKPYINFNNFVVEKENVGEEEMENDIGLVSRGKDIKRLNYDKVGNDLNAALEIHSNEPKYMPIHSKEQFKNASRPYLNKNEHEMHKTISKEPKGIGFFEISKSNKFYVWNQSFLKANGVWNYRNFDETEISKLSILSRRLYLHEDIGKAVNKTFLINVYKYGPLLERRLIKHYTSKKTDPFENCSVKNCKISYKDHDFHIADAILFHLHRMEASPSNISRQNFKQYWVWMSDESPFNTFVLAKEKNIDHYNNLFNWSMTYRSSSDVPVPYGRTVPVFDNYDYQYSDIFYTKNKTVAILGSNCGGKNMRWGYVKRLREFINVDTYGGCGQLKCPGHFNIDCDLLKSYKFYLAFENSNCLEYITEKAWWNAFAKFSVPVVMGSSKRDYLKLFPPDSFIFVEDFNSPKDLAEYILFLASNEEAYSKYHAWRRHYAIVNEHGYFQTDIFHYCRLCEALNYNTMEQKTYSILKNYWNVSRDCYPAKWMDRML